jgi:hypothetical protein
MTRTTGGILPCLNLWKNIRRPNEKFAIYKPRSNSQICDVRPICLRGRRQNHRFAPRRHRARIPLWRRAFSSLRLEGTSSRCVGWHSLLTFIASSECRYPYAISCHSLSWTVRCPTRGKRPSTPGSWTLACTRSLIANSPTRALGAENSTLSD